VRRFALASLLLLAACPAPGPECGDGITCTADEVCANTHECYPPDQVHAVTVHWTIRGQPASATTCPDPNLELSIQQFGADALTYSPVVCANGFFGFDKLPVDYDGVAVDDPATGARGQTSIPPAGGDVTVDLP
jgi:hypothetical protein